MDRLRLATLWLDGCSGCHMSFLDMDERLIDLADRIEIVYGPLVDVPRPPESVDAALVEGAVSTTADRETLHRIRERSRILVAFGDCAVTANVPGMRNLFDREAVLARAYGGAEPDGPAGPAPSTGIPELCRRVRPLHAFVRVDAFLPGCPPPADAIHHLVVSLLDGVLPELAGRTRFGA